jgi:hypothetical protein
MPSDIAPVASILRRGLAAVQGEWTLVTMAWNIKRMAVMAR